MAAAGQFCMYAEKKVLDQVFGATAWTAPATLYIGLYTDAQGATAAKIGGTFTEPSANNYARLPVTNNTTNFPGATGVSGTDTKATKTSANGPYTFNVPSGSWGTIQGFFVADAATVGNIIYFDDIATPQAVGSGNTVSFATGGIVITLQ